MKPARVDIYCKWFPTDEVWRVWALRHDLFLGRFEIAEFDERVDARNCAYTIFLALDAANVQAAYYYENLEPVHSDALEIALKTEEWKR